MLPRRPGRARFGRRLRVCFQASGRRSLELSFVSLCRVSCRADRHRICRLGTGCDDLRDEVGWVSDGTASCNPDIAGHIDDDSTATAGKAGSLLEAIGDAGEGSEIGWRDADITHAGGAGVVRRPDVVLRVNGDPGWLLRPPSPSAVGQLVFRVKLSPLPVKYESPLIGPYRGDDDTAVSGDSDAVAAVAQGIERCGEKLAGRVVGNGCRWRNL